MEKNGGGGAAPTGCFKCGRPGHWSRDCPSSGANPNPNPNPSTTPGSFPSKFPQGATKPAEKDKATKKPPRTRPKLTPELLLSDNGLGYVLRHFPRSFKYHGRGHEVEDLGNLIGLYAQWNSHLIPYYSFDQFIHKVEQVGATRRVRMCIRDLRERVANGGDPTKLHEPPTEQNAPDGEPEEAMDVGSIPDMVDPVMESHNADNMQEELFNEIYQKATDEPPQSVQQEACQKTPEYEAASEASPENGLTEGLQNQGGNNNTNTFQKLTEEQRARMEANRLKALEKAAARARTLQAA